MTFPRSISLSGKVALLTLFNLALLVGLALLAIGFQLRNGLESILLAPAIDRMTLISQEVVLDLETTPTANWNQLLAEYGNAYQARVFLYEPSALYIAGETEPLPPEVRAEFPIRRGAPAPTGRGAFESLEGADPIDSPRAKGPPNYGPRLGKGKGKGKNGGSVDSGKQKGSRRGGAPAPIFLVITDNPTRYWIGARVPLADPSGSTQPGMLLLETDSLFNPQLFFDYRLVGGATFAALLVSLLCWMPFMRGLTRSIRQMNESTQRLAEGDFNSLLDPKRNDELGHLGGQINIMAARLSDFLLGQKRFLGDVAHELSAPVARIQMALAILEHQNEDRNEHLRNRHTERKNHRPHHEAGESTLAQQRTVQDLQEEVAHLADLINELLQFSKAALRPGEIELEPMDVAETVESVVAREAAARGVVSVQVPPGLSVMANPAYFTRSIGNLVRNALRYAGHAGPVEVAAYSSNGEVILIVADHGPGIDPQELERIFEPFYRPEQSRSRDSGSTGLGLAIVKTGIESCHGSVQCRNRQPHGLEVTLRLPQLVASEPAPAAV